MLCEPVREKPAGQFEAREIGAAETGAPYYHMIKHASGPRAAVNLRYARGVDLLCCLDGDWGPGLGCIFVGDEGTIEVNRDKAASTPGELLEQSDRPAPLSVLETQPHVEDWMACIKSRGRCTADIEFGHRSNSICCLINIAREVGEPGKPLAWDPVAERFTNSEEANAALSRPPREGYALPA